jgi:hypothetical protein
MLVGRVKRPDKDSSQAVLGRWVHARIAQRLKDEEGAVGPEIVFPDHKATRFDEWIASFCIDTARMYIEPHLALEVEAEYAWEFERFKLVGHLDCASIDANATEACDFDWKAGSAPVTIAADNPQLLGYRVLRALNFPTLQKILTALVQPQNDEDSGIEKITVVRAETREQLDREIAYLEQEINRSLDHQFDLNSDGFRQCQYCPAALVCPAFENDVEKMKLTLTPEQFAAIPSEPDLEKLYRFEEAAKKFEAPLALAHDTLKARVMEMGGAELSDGTKLFVVDRPGAREITDNAAATAALQCLSDDRFHQSYKFRPGEIERLLAEQFDLPKTSKKGDSGQTEYKERLGAITVQKTNSVLKVA